MKKIKDIAFVGPLSQRRIWKDVSGAPTWVPNPIYSTQTSLSAVCFLSGTHSSIGSSPLQGKDEEKMFWLGDHEVLQLWWSLEETEILPSWVEQHLGLCLFHLLKDYFGHWTPTGKWLVPYLTFQPSLSRVTTQCLSDFKICMKIYSYG